MSVMDEVHRTLDLLHPGRMVEIRALGVPMKTGRRVTVSGYFHDHALAAQAAARLDDEGAVGIYFCINEIHPGAYARAPEQLVYAPEHTTTDKDIIRRRWMLIDADPVRPAGVSSTDHELEAAHGLICRIRNHFVEWFQPYSLVMALSGNGYHLLVELDEAVEQLAISQLLNDLQYRYAGGTGVQIDQTVTKLAQLSKLYGTRARKGFPVSGRPHRQSLIVDVWSDGKLTQDPRIRQTFQTRNLPGKSRFHRN